MECTFLHRSHIATIAFGGLDWFFATFARALIYPAYAHLDDVELELDFVIHFGFFFHSVKVATSSQLVFSSILTLFRSIIAHFTTNND